MPCLHMLKTGGVILLFRDKNRVMAEVRGSIQYPEVYGVVYFEKSAWGVLVTAQIYGLPAQEGEESGFFGVHIHEGSSCTESGEAPFSDAGGHYVGNNIHEKVNKYLILKPLPS